MLRVRRGGNETCSDCFLFGIHFLSSVVLGEGGLCVEIISSEIGVYQ